MPLYIYGTGHVISTHFSQDSLAENGATYLFNHNHIQLFYHKGTSSTTQDGRIVRAMVRLASCADPTCSKPLKLPTPEELKAFTAENPFLLNYTYTVEFIVSEDMLHCQCAFPLFPSYTCH